jgi:hypothetical protein
VVVHIFALTAFEAWRIPSSAGCATRRVNVLIELAQIRIMIVVYDYYLLSIEMYIALPSVMVLRSLRSRLQTPWDAHLTFSLSRL